MQHPSAHLHSVAVSIRGTFGKLFLGEFREKVLKTLDVVER
jgi:hypothetical protein